MTATNVAGYFVVAWCLYPRHLTLSLPSIFRSQILLGSLVSLFFGSATTSPSSHKWSGLDIGFRSQEISGEARAKAPEGQKEPEERPTVARLAGPHTTRFELLLSVTTTFIVFLFYLCPHQSVRSCHGRKQKQSLCQSLEVISFQKSIDTIISRRSFIQQCKDSAMSRRHSGTFTQAKRRGGHHPLHSVRAPSSIFHTGQRHGPI